jgi:methionyl-tRNA synthetase
MHMPDTKTPFYLTTPIYYVNARPHIGHAYTTIVADVVARRRRLLGQDVWFLTGTDEHGQKIERAARAANTSPQQFADGVSIQFRNLWDRMGLTYDQYIRTTDEAHKRGVQKLFTALKDKGFISLNTYTGQYCVSDEAFVDVGVGEPCPDCGRITETVSEENYYFKLSAFQKQLIDLIHSGQLDVQPETRRNEVLSFLRGNLQAEGAQLATSDTGLTYVPGALKDLSISRSSFDWGIPVPGDPKHVIYVWLDALANYITAIGYGSDAPADKEKFAKFWPADLHLVGKEIIRFHCVYWPAFLLAAGLPLPKKIVAHGWLLFEESKMSKSRGNIVRAETILEAFGSLKPDVPKSEQDLFGADVLRYFLLREIPFGSDGSFSFDAVWTRYNAELTNGYGNLVSRTLTMIQKYFDGEIPTPRTVESIGVPQRIIPDETNAPKHDSFLYHPKSLAENAIAFLNQVDRAFAQSNLPINLNDLYSIPMSTDTVISAARPWKRDLANPEERAIVSDVLYFAAEAIRIYTAAVYPVLPHATAAVWQQLGLGDIELAAKNGHLTNLQWGGLQPGTKLGTLGPIFPRADKELITRMNEIEQNNAAAAQQSTEAAPSPFAVELNAASQTADAAATAITAPAVAPDRQMINIDDFMKVELRVAEIRVAERIPKSDKLLRLEVDLGTEQRQILAGIAEHYAPETLIGRRIIIVANLAPRKMRGLESQGMLLAASLGEGDKPAIASFLDSVELGARVR